MEVFRRLFRSTRRARPLLYSYWKESSDSSIHPETSTSASINYAEVHRNKLESLKPNETFLATLNNEQLDVVSKLMKELEVYLWMAPTAPEMMSDDHWRRMLTQKSVFERVTFLRYLALTQHRARRDALRKKTNNDELQKRFAAEKEKFDRGAMGYGPGMYQILSNPLRNKKRIHQQYGIRVWRSMRLDDKPHIVFDMQFLHEMVEKRRNVIANQMQYLIAENFQREEPFQLTFANFNDQLESNKRLLHDFVGFYNGEHTDQLILPDFVNKSIRQLYPDEKEIVYISRYGREVLDGPLQHRVYVICASYDLNRESIGAARKGNFRAMRLPFKRYVRWQSGPQYLPFINLLRVLDEVYQSNGDWRNALLNNISKRHLRSDEEKSAYAVFNAEKTKEKKRELEELVKMIEDATANI
uniref:SAM-dependent MTase TRM10-type domain-containing protein n=1 Tax=Parascaris univalens TaxID=6257 RepID=A0A914ZNZ2_PARUN